MNPQAARVKQMYDAMFHRQGIDPKVGYALLAAAAGTTAVGQGANLVDLATGPTNAINSGELPMNAALMATLPMGAGLVGGYVVDGLDRFRNERAYVDREVANVKAGLKITHVSTVLKQLNADLQVLKVKQNKDLKEIVTETVLAGQVLGSMFGTGLAINKMADETPNLQVNPYVG